MDFLVRHTAAPISKQAKYTFVNAGEMLAVAAPPTIESLYRDIRAGRPDAVRYYLELKRKYEEGKRAQMLLDALQALHEQQKVVRPLVGAEGGFITPNGRVLTQEALTALVSACYACLPR